MSDSEEWESAAPRAPEQRQDYDLPCPGDGVEEVFGEDSGVHIDVDASGSVIPAESPGQAASGNPRRPGRTREAVERFVVASRVTYLAWLSWAAHCDELANSVAIVAEVVSQAPQFGSAPASAVRSPPSQEIVEQIAGWLSFRFPVDAEASSASLGCESEAALLRVLSERRLQTPCLPAHAAVIACSLLRKRGLLARIAVAFDLPAYCEQVRGSSGGSGGAAPGVTPTAGRKRARPVVHQPYMTGVPASNLEGVAGADVDVIDGASPASAHRTDASDAARGPNGKACRVRIWTEVLVSCAAADNWSMDAPSASAASSPSASPSPRWLALEPGSSSLIEVPSVLTKSPGCAGGAPSRSRTPRPFSCVVTAGPGDAALLRDATLDCYSGQPLRWEVAYGLQRSHGLLGDAAQTLRAPASAVLSRSLVRDSRAGAAASAEVASAVRLARLGSGDPHDVQELSAPGSGTTTVGRNNRRPRLSAKSAALSIASAAEGSLLVDGATVCLDAFPPNATESISPAAATHGKEGVAWIDYALASAGVAVLSQRLRRVTQSLKLQDALQAHLSRLTHPPAARASRVSVVDLLDDSSSDETEPVAGAYSAAGTHVTSKAKDRPSSLAPETSFHSAATPLPRTAQPTSRLVSTSIPFPGKLDAYKKHAHFALERFLASDEMIYPREPVLGFHRGEPIFPRAHVHRLRTADQWLRQEARLVAALPAEAHAGSASDAASGRPLPPPAKWGVPRRLAAARRRGEPKAGGGPQPQPSLPTADDEETGPAGDATLALYGVWQTVPFVPAAHSPGSPLPRNEHGNLELWGGNRAFLPAGLEWVPIKTARAAAASIGVESVDVVIGFEHRAGRPFPVQLGVAVEESAAPAVRAAAEAIGQAAIMRGISDRARRVLSRWATLTRGLLVAQRVHAQYSCVSASYGVVAGATEFVLLPSDAAGPPRATDGGDAQSPQTGVTGAGGGAPSEPMATG